VRSKALLKKNYKGEVDNMVLGFLKRGGKDKSGGDGRERGPGSDSATQEVRRLASQGYSEQEIIRELRDMGYPNENIKRSINKVLKSKISSSDGEAQASRRSGNFGDRLPDTRGGPGSGPRDNRYIAPPPSPPLQNEGGDAGRGDFGPMNEGPRMEEEPRGDKEVWEMTEEEEIELEVLIEEMIDEKWEFVESRVEELELGVDELRDEVDEIKDRLEGLGEKHEKQREKLEEKTDKTFTHIQGIESRIGSVEKAFKEFLPALTENVRSLSGVVKDLKQDSPSRGTSSTPGSSSLPSTDIPDSPENYLEESGDRRNKKDKGDSVFDE